MGSLFFTCGLPRSGKSFYCDNWILPDEGDIEYTPRAIVCGDDFRYALYGREFQIEAEGTVFAMMDVAARALLKRGFDVIIDETCTTEATLLRYLRINIDAQAIFIDTPIEVCKERAIACGRDYLLGPIDRMAAQLEKLKAEWPDNFNRLKEYLRSRQTQDISI